jgi:hypothetical protein
MDDEKVDDYIFPKTSRVDYQRMSGMKDEYQGFIKVWTLEEICELWTERSCTAEVCLEILAYNNVNEILSSEQKEVVHITANYPDLPRAQRAKIHGTLAKSFREKLDQAIRKTKKKIFPRALENDIFRQNRREASRM